MGGWDIAAKHEQTIKEKDRIIDLLGHELTCKEAEIEGLRLRLDEANKIEAVARTVSQLGGVVSNCVSSSATDALQTRVTDPISLAGALFFAEARDSEKPASCVLAPEMQTAVRSIADEAAAAAIAAYDAKLPARFFSIGQTPRGR